MKKEFDPSCLPEDKKEEILKQMASSQEEKKFRKAKQKEAGKRQSLRRKELIRFASEKNVKFFEAYSLCRGGYTVLVGYVPPVKTENQKKNPITTIGYTISCCSPTDKYDEEKGKLMIIERIRKGEVALLTYRTSRIPESTEDSRLPMLIDLDLIHCAATGIDNPGVAIPQAIIDADPNA